MTLSHILFGLSGRISRKTYWLASTGIAAVAIGLFLIATWIVTGNPFSPVVWQREAGQSATWLPLWGGYMALLFWPSTAIAVKRLHDRDRPAWIWFVYFGFNFAYGLASAEEGSRTEINASQAAALIAYVAFTAYILIELALLPGTRGPNRHGPDPLPQEYYERPPGFLSWMFSPKGRIDRGKWWLGVLILTGAGGALMLMTAIAIGIYAGFHPDLMENLKNPGWLKSPEAQPIMSQLGLIFSPLGLFMWVALWCLTALGVKRLHDRGLSGWLILVVVVPILALILAPALAEVSDVAPETAQIILLMSLASIIWGVLQFGILKGETGPNKHGPDPLAGL